MIRLTWFLSAAVAAVCFSPTPAHADVQITGSKAALGRVLKGINDGKARKLKTLPRGLREAEPVATQTFTNLSTTIRAFELGKSLYANRTIGKQTRWFEIE